MSVSSRTSNDVLKTTLKEYTLFEKVGQGSFGVVRRAHDGTSDNHLAIKQLVRICDDNGMIRRVLREIRIMSSLQHVNLLGLSDLYYHREAIYFVMELCCIDLYALSYVNHAAYSHLQTRDFVEIMRQILEGLKHMHSCHIVHRDIKPSNILLDEFQQIKICDFGLSRQLVSASAPDSAYRTNLAPVATPELVNTSTSTSAESSLSDISFSSSSSPSDATSCFPRHAAKRVNEKDVGRDRGYSDTTICTDSEADSYESYNRSRSSTTVTMPSSTSYTNVVTDTNTNTESKNYAACGTKLPEKEQERVHEPMTPYVVTRWYRAPEVMLTDGQYDAAQDVWAAACTFAEFATRKPLFPGKCSVDQLRLIMKGLGRPGPRDLSFAGISSYGLGFINAQPNHEAQGLGKLLAMSSLSKTSVQGPFVQVMRGMLQYNPSRRLSCSVALTMPFFSAKLLCTASLSTESTSTYVEDTDAVTYTGTNIEDLVTATSIRAAAEAEMRASPITHTLNLDDIEHCHNDRSALTSLLRNEVGNVQTELGMRLLRQKGRDVSMEKFISLNPNPNPNPKTCTEAVAASVSAFVSAAPPMFSPSSKQYASPLGCNIRVKHSSSEKDKVRSKDAGKDKDNRHSPELPHEYGQLLSPQSRLLTLVGTDTGFGTCTGTGTGIGLGMAAVFSPPPDEVADDPFLTSFVSPSVLQLQIQNTGKGKDEGKGRGENNDRIRLCKTISSANLYLTDNNTSTSTNSNSGGSSDGSNIDINISRNSSGSTCREEKCRRKVGGILASVTHLLGTVASQTKKAVKRSLRNLDGFK